MELDFLESGIVIQIITMDLTDYKSKFRIAGVSFFYLIATNIAWCENLTMERLDREFSEFRTNIENINSTGPIYFVDGVKYEDKRLAENFSKHLFKDNNKSITFDFCLNGMSMPLVRLRDICYNLLKLKIVSSGENLSKLEEVGYSPYAEDSDVRSIKIKSLRELIK